MKGFLKLVTLAFLLFPFQAGAAVRPDVKVNRIKTEIGYETSKPMTSCGPSATGCTSSALQYSILVDCRKKQIVLSFGYPKITVQIINQYKKGSIDFDATLKHELTHVALRKKIIERFYKPAASACLMQYERSAAQTNDCESIRADVEKIFFKYMKRLEEEVERHDNLIDGTENYTYQSLQVLDEKEKQLNRRRKKNSRSKRGKIVVLTAENISDRKHSSAKDGSSSEKTKKKETPTDLALVTPQPRKRNSARHTEEEPADIPWKEVEESFAKIGPQFLSGLPVFQNIQHPKKGYSSDRKTSASSAPTQPDMLRKKKWPVPQEKTVEKNLKEDTGTRQISDTIKRDWPVFRFVRNLFAETMEEFKLREKFSDFWQKITSNFSENKTLSGNTEQEAK